MQTVSVQDLQKDPGAVLDRVEAGERIAVFRDGRSIAELHPVMAPPVALRPYGLGAGEFTVPDDFDAPLPEEVLREFEGA